MEGFMRGVSNNLLLRHDRSNCIYQGEPGTAQVAGRNYRFAHNRVSNRGSLRSTHYAANASAGTVPGSRGVGIKGAIWTILSDPHRPHLCLAEDETMLQLSQ